MRYVLITRVLLQTSSVTVDVTIRYSIEVEMRIEWSTILGATHPFPLVFALTTELAEAYQIHTATSLEAKLP